MSGPASSKQRQRRVAAVGAAGEQAQRLQTLGDALDDAVRALRSRDALAEGLCRRVHELWMAERAHVIEWHPTELRAAGKLVLAASAQGGRFILPAFASGLRAIAMREQCVPADVLRLLQQLGELEPGAESVTAFARFLFSSAALGFDAAQDESAYELAEGLRAGGNDEDHWAERSRSAVELWNDMAWKAGQALDAGTLEERYRTPLERAAVRLAHGELLLSEDGAAALREAAADEATWARAEIALLCAQPALRAALSSTHVAFRLAAVIESHDELDERLPELLTALTARGASAPPALEARIVGAALGRRLLAGGLDPGAPLALAERIGPDLISGMLAHLDEREDGCEAAVASLALLIERRGLPFVLGRCDAVRLRPSLAVALLRAAVQVQVPGPEIAAVLARLPPRSALAAMTAVPALLRTASAVLRSLMDERIEELEPLLPAFVRCSHDAARALGAVLVSTHGAGFSADGLEAMFGALVEAGLGREVVVEIWGSQQASSNARLAALAALESHPSLLAEALERRGPQRSDPLEIRIALKELRWRHS